MLTLARPLRAPATVAPLVLGAAGLVACALLYVVDPNGPGRLTVCPFRAATGLDCPACGGLRSVHDLLHGQVLAALDRNALVAVAVPLAVVAWARWARRSWSGARMRPPSARAAYAFVVAVLVFWVLRDLPGVPFLGSSS